MTSQRYSSEMTNTVDAMGTIVPALRRAGFHQYFLAALAVDYYNERYVKHNFNYEAWLAEQQLVEGSLPSQEYDVVLSYVLRYIKTRRPNVGSADEFLRAFADPDYGIQRL